MTDLFAAVIDRTASFVARSANPPQFEEKIREGQRSDPKFSFLNPADPYHAYYRHKIDKVFQGDMEEEAAQASDAQVLAGSAERIIDIGIEAPPPLFTVEMPNITAFDLCVLPSSSNLSEYLQGPDETHRTLHSQART